MKVALVHDFLTEYGGAERVVEALHEIWPDAPLYTAYYNPEGLGPHRDKFKDWQIITSSANKIPFFKKILSPARIIAPVLFENFDLSKFDVVISSTNMYFSKAVLTNQSQVHISYCHTPPRYLYGYPTPRQFRKYFFGRIVSGVLNHFLRIYDFLTSQRVDYFIANSKNTAGRILKFYRREAEVIYPPVDTKKFGVGSRELGENKKQKKSTNSNPQTPYYLCVSRLYRPKRIDLAIEAANKMGFKLKIAGTGSEEGNLRKMAGKNVQFLGDVSDDQLAFLYRNAKATIFPAEEEDFGIVPVESQALGTPVIALRQGGNLESIVEGKTGEFFDQPKSDLLINSLRYYESKRYSAKSCIENAKQFDKEVFKSKIKNFVEDKIRRG